jgi:hypothetical protein
VLARFRAKPLDSIEINHQQVCKFRQAKWIEGGISAHSRKIAKALSVKFELPPLLTWR